MKIKTEIVTQTDRIILLIGRAGIKGWCPLCSAESRLLTPEQAATITQTDARSIYRLIETPCAEQTWVAAGGIHLFETKEGFLFVCLNSIG